MNVAACSATDTEDNSAKTDVLSLLYNWTIDKMRVLTPRNHQLYNQQRKFICRNYSMAWGTTGPWAGWERDRVPKKTFQAPTQGPPLNRSKRPNIPRNDKQTCSGPWREESQNLPPKAYWPQPSEEVQHLPYNITRSALATHQYREDIGSK